MVRTPRAGPNVNSLLFPDPGRGQFCHDDLKMELRKLGWGDSTFVHDEGRGLFRFTDGRLAFPRQHVDWQLSRKRGG